MMYRRAAGEIKPRPMRVLRVRWLSIVNAMIYLLGAILLINTPSDQAIELGEIAGYVLIMLALVGTILVMLTGTRRVAAEEVSRLDEMERMLREKALSRAFHIFSVATVIGIFYLEIAHDLAKRDDIHLWLPSTGDDWKMIGWGVIIALITLPSAVLAWMLPAREPGE